MIPFESIKLNTEYVSQLYREYSLKGRHIATDIEQLDMLVQEITAAYNNSQSMKDSDYPIIEGATMSITQYKKEVKKEYKFKSKLYISNIANLYFGEN